MPPRRRVRRIRAQAPGSANSANQPIPFHRWSLEWWAISCASTTRTAPSENLPSSSVLQSTILRVRAEPDRIGVRLARLAAHVLHRHRHAGDPLLPLEVGGRRPERRALERCRPRHEVGGREGEQRADRDEHGRSGQPPPLAQPAGEEHHDHEGERDRGERGPEREPVAERPFEVADLGQVVAARPPEVEQPERELDEPDDPQPEHAEQHPGPDRPGRRLPAEARPALRVHPERREQHDLLERPADAEQPLDVLGLAHDVAAEDGVDVERRQGEAPGDGGAEQQPGTAEPRSGGQRGDRDPRRSGQLNPRTASSSGSGSDGGRQAAGASRPGGREPRTGSGR